MELNHINLPVVNVEEAKTFFEQHFNFTCIEVKGDNALAVLKGDNNFTLVLMSQAFNRGEAKDFPSAFHIGFLLKSREEVTEKYDQLKLSGIDLEHAPANMRGIFGFYFMAPGSILIEVSSE